MLLIQALTVRILKFRVGLVWFRNECCLSNSFLLFVFAANFLSFSQISFICINIAIYDLVRDVETAWPMLTFNSLKSCHSYFR